MNCKPGDKCVTLFGENGRNAGKFVTTIRLLEPHEHNVAAHAGPVWLIDRDMSYTNLFGERNWHPWAPDKKLMPINPRGDDVLIVEETASSDEVVK